jgi:hypothetical protein
MWKNPARQANAPPTTTPDMDAGNVRGRMARLQAFQFTRSFLSKFHIRKGIGFIVLISHILP